MPGEEEEYEYIKKGGKRPPSAVGKEYKIRGAIELNMLHNISHGKAKVPFLCAHLSDVWLVVKRSSL